MPALPLLKCYSFDINQSFIFLSKCNRELFVCLFVFILAWMSRCGNPAFQEPPTHWDGQEKKEMKTVIGTVTGCIFQRWLNNSSQPTTTLRQWGLAVPSQGSNPLHWHPGWPQWLAGPWECEKNQFLGFPRLEHMRVSHCIWGLL